MLTKLEAEVNVLRKLVPLLSYLKDDQFNHGEDCEFWDFEEEKPSGKECECGTEDIRQILLEYEQVMTAKE